jgi:micrococcal nuclease
MRFFVLLLSLCALSLPALAAEAISGDALRLDDGRVARLRGIKAPAGDEAKAALQALIAGRTLSLEGAPRDRYGRSAADVTAQSADGEKIWLQGEMLREGQAFVYPPAGDEPRLGDLLKNEREARRAGRGLWSDPAFADAPAADPAKVGIGRFAFAAGKVVRAGRVKNTFYLNFGEDWRTDFTVAIAAHDLRRFRAAGIDPLDYEGKTVRVRGWVRRDNGPMIAVTTPAQIEMLGGAPAKP